MALDEICESDSELYRPTESWIGLEHRSELSGGIKAAVQGISLSTAKELKLDQKKYKASLAKCDSMASAYAPRARFPKALQNQEGRAAY